VDIGNLGKNTAPSPLLIVYVILNMEAMLKTVELWHSEMSNYCFKKRNDSGVGACDINTYICKFVFTAILKCCD